MNHKRRPPARSALILAALLGFGAAAEEQSSPTPPAAPVENPAPTPAQRQLDAVKALLDGQLAVPPEETAQSVADYAELARHYAENKLFDQALAAHRKAIELLPDQPPLAYALAQLLERAERNDEAVAAYKDFLAAHPDYFPAAARLANLLRRMGRLDEADRLLTGTIAAMVAQQPGLAALFSQRGSLRHAQRRTPEAASDLELALAAAPEANRLHEELAAVYGELRDPARAEPHLKEKGAQGIPLPDPLLGDNQADITPDRPLLLRAEIAQRLGRTEEAMEAYREAITLHPESVTAYLGLGALLASEKGDNAGARALFEQAAKVAPEDPAPPYNLATLLAGTGDREGALRLLGEAARLAGEEIEMRLTIGQAFRRLNAPDQALEQFNQVVSRQPKAIGAWLGAAGTLLDQERYAESRQVLEQAHTENPEDGQIAHDLARLLAASPDPAIRNGHLAFELARQVFAARNNAENGETLAMALAELGRCDEAVGLQGDILKSAEGQLPEQEIARIKERLAWYKEKRPCRPPVEDQTAPENQGAAKP